MLRLRKCGRNTTCPELMGRCSIVRELHVYGTAVPVHGRDADKLQHQVNKLMSLYELRNNKCSDEVTWDWKYAIIIV